MEPKKNPQFEVKRNTNLYFVIGLAAVLLLTYVVLEWKTFYENDIYFAQRHVPQELIEVVPITAHKLPEPPKPKIQAPPVIEVEDDDDDVIETVIESNDIDQDTEIASIDDIEVIDPDIPDELSFIVVEDVPVFPGCEKATDKRACFQEMIQKHIRKNFRYPELAQEMGLQGRVNVVFTIEKDGSIGNVRMRGPHEVLEGEAARIISKLPKMTPGKQRGTPVKVPFAIPITFKLQ